MPVLIWPTQASEKVRVANQVQRRETAEVSSGFLVSLHVSWPQPVRLAYTRAMSRTGSVARLLAECGRRGSSLPGRLAAWLGVIAPLLAIQPAFAQAVPTGKVGVVGDSISAATHASDMCGRRDIIDCVSDLGGRQSRAWSFAAGEASWSLASRLGYSPNRVVDVSDDGEEWKDALEQAQRVTEDPEVDTVLIGLGANDVCQARGHDYTGDIELAESHIDATLLHLTDSLPSGGTVYWTAVPDIVRLHGLMRQRDHNIVFENCQATWDLDDNKVKDGAAADACDHFSDNDACGLFDGAEEAKDFLVKLLLDQWLDSEGVEEGPCGKVLSSRSTDADRAEALQYLTDLNELMARKANEYRGRNGVRVIFNDHVFRKSVFEPYHLSRFDCYHPSRTGQMFLADEIWQGFMLQGNLFGTEHHERVYVDEFNAKDYCNEDLTPWDGCWTEVNDNGTADGGDVQIDGQRLRVRDNAREIWRAVPLPDTERAWVSFNWRRNNLDRGADYVTFEVSPDGGLTWIELDRFRGDADDYGLHRGNYYNISSYAGSDTRIRFVSAPGLGGQDEVFVDNVTIQSWRDTGVRVPVVLYELAGGKVWRLVPARGF